MKSMLSALGLLAARLIVAAIFGWAAVIKLGNIQSFGDAVKGFKVFGQKGYYGPRTDHLNILVTYAVPWVEILCAALLILGLWTRAAGVLLWLLTSAFIIAIMSVLYRQIDVKCGCFGDGYLLCPGAMSPCHVFQNGIILAIVLVCVFAGGGRISLDSLFARGKRPVGPDEVDSVNFRPL
jgi:uncharacterized membrane protein YphA (DoxX/SURF4 family)